MKKFYFIILTFLFITLTCSAQTKQLISADNAFDAREYFVAKDLYKKAYSKEKDRKIKAEIRFKMAECYRMMADYKMAATYYKQAIKMKYDDSIAKLYYADALKAQALYEEAAEAYADYRKTNPADQRGEIGVESCKKSQDWLDSPSRYVLENMSLINSKKSDFAPSYGKSDFTVLYFTSARDASSGKDVDGWTGESFTDLFITTQERKTNRPTSSRSSRGSSSKSTGPKWKEPVLIDGEDGVVNSPFNEGGCTVDPRGTKLFFTRCGKEKNKDLGCSIYESRKKGKSWANPTPVVLVNDSSTVGHPSITADGKRLYFASDMPGGYGGKDIWYSVYDKRKRKWGAPVNAGEVINTSYDEMYPNIHDDVLFFTSDGHVGMGGFDIYKATKDTSGNWVAVENMQYPINTNADDFSIIFENNKAENGFVASNRKGGKGGDDIYKVKLLPRLFMLQGVVTDAKTGSELGNVKVSMVGSDGTSLQVTTDANGSYLFGVDQVADNTTYKLTFEKNDYLNKSGDVTTLGVLISAFELTNDGYLHTMVHDKALEPIRRPIVLPKIEYDVDKYDLRIESMDALDELVEVLLDNPNIVIELRAHTDYRQTRSYKGGNMELSQYRADTCVAYLISKGIESGRLSAVGKGATEPFTIPKTYEGDYFDAGDKLSRSFIDKLRNAEEKEAGHQLNRRTDFKVLRDDYVPSYEEENQGEDN